MNLQTAGMVLQITTVLYFISMAGYLLFLFNQKPIHQKTAFFLISTAIVFHFISMAIYTIATLHVPIQNLPQSLSLAAFSLGCMFLFFQYKFDLKIPSEKNSKITLEIQAKIVKRVTKIKPEFIKELQK